VIENTSVLDGEQVRAIPLEQRSDSVEVVITGLPKTGYPGGDSFDPGELERGPILERAASHWHEFLGKALFMLSSSAVLFERRRWLAELSALLARRWIAV
jgi:hypothetical protein